MMRDSRQHDDQDVDGMDTKGLEPCVRENWAASRYYSTARIEHISSTEENQAMTDRRIARGRVEDQDTGIASRDGLI